MKIQRNVDLKRHTTFRIGGAARRFYTVDKRHELKQLWPELLADETPGPFLLGRGSNLLVDDGVIERPIVRLTGDFRSCGFDDTLMKAGSACLMPELAMSAAKAGLTGMEWASGVPGTVGGAVVMNAGAYNREVKDVLSWVELLTADGEIERIPADNLTMEYRHTDLPENTIVLRAAFRLKRRSFAKVVQATRALVEKRRTDQPVGPPSAGCMFKNPNGQSAGQLIDRAGMAGEREGDIVVSEQHANYFLNRGEGTCEDVLRLRDRVREAVQKEFGVELEQEVHRLA